MGETKTSAPIPFTSPANVTAILGGEYQVTTIVNGQPVVGPWINHLSPVGPGDTVKIRLTASQNPQESAVAHLVITNGNGETTKYTEEVITGKAPEVTKTPEIKTVNAMTLSPDKTAPTEFHEPVQVTFPVEIDGKAVTEILLITVVDGKPMLSTQYTGEPLPVSATETYAFKVFGKDEDLLAKVFVKVYPPDAQK